MKSSDEIGSRLTKKGGIRVLVVDDEEDIRLVARDALTREGYEVSTAPNAIEALKRFEQINPDVVLTDIIMPGMSGTQLLAEVHRRSPDVQVIVMTGEPTYESAAEAVRHGALDYLAKPLKLNDIRLTISRAATVKGLIDEKRRLEQENLSYQRELESLVEVRTAELSRTNVQLKDEIVVRRNVEQQLQVSLEKLHRTVDDVIHTMSLTIEKRDPYTAGHQQRVAIIARALAEELGLSEEQIKGTYMTGLIHDVGKIIVPAEILSKPAPLCEEEMALIRRHSQIGSEIMERIEFPWPVAALVLQHHERLDGSGYPNRLSGDQILIEARIIAVADVFEAMCHHRPYRPSRGLQQALAELQTNAGKLYDPLVVEACTRLVERGAITPDDL